MSKICCRKRVFCSLVFVALLVACCSSWSTAWAQAKPQTAPATKPLPVPELPKVVTVDKLIVDRFSCFGPANLKTVTPQSLIFPGKDADEDGTTISLTGKPVTVTDQVGSTQSLSALRSGTRVIVCQRADRVVVIITPEKKRVGNARY
jgi:hypothetical protein